MRRAWRSLLFTILVAGAPVLLGRPSALALDDSPREIVERLVPRLLSATESIREQAETELFRAGDVLFGELERLARDRDPVRSELGLRLLQSVRWDRAPANATPADTRTLARPVETRRQPDFVLVSHAGLTAPARVVSIARTPSGEPVSSRGSVMDGRDRVAWYLEHSGRSWVSIRRDGQALGRTYESHSITAMRAAHPDVVARLDRVAAVHADVRALLGSGRHRTTPREETAPRPEPDRRERHTSAEPEWGVEWQKPSRTLHAQLGLSPGAVVVRSVSDGGVGARLGLRDHDVLVSLCGRDLAVSDRPLPLAPPSGRTVSATVIRGGTRVVLRLAR